MGWGQAPRRRHWPPSPRKAPQEQSRQVSWLAAPPYALRLPRGSPLSDLGRVRSAHSCGAALVLHQLPYSQHPAVRYPGFLRPVNSWCTLPPSPGPCKSNCAAGAVRVVHTPSRRSRVPEAPGEQAGSISLCRPVVLVFGTALPGQGEGAKALPLQRAGMHEHPCRHDLFTGEEPRRAARGPGGLALFQPLQQRGKLPTHHLVPRARAARPHHIRIGAAGLRDPAPLRRTLR
jgi:hypothetical protein